MTRLVARHHEREILGEVLRSTDPELVAVFGRRRVGKTFLIREALSKETCFELVGIHRADLPTQLRSFAAALAEASRLPSLDPPGDWHEAFAQLRRFLETRLARRRSKLVVVFDEVPWLASRRSGFLPAFEHFWNAWASRQRQLAVVLCGSAASWMLENLVRERGGLHNRVTRRLRVEPFTLADTEELLRARRVELGRRSTTELYLAMGGVPHYLSQVRPGESAAQAIDRLCFSRDGLLRTEFDHLYASLFEQAGKHEAVVRALAMRRRGLTRNMLLDEAGLGSGGTMTRVLSELEESGFVLPMPRLGRLKKETVYWLSDEYSLFYLSWIDGHRGNAGGTWLRKRGTPAWRAWSGLAFEALCLKHVPQLKHALGISGVETVEAAWEHRPTRRGEPDGAQIDLVIDRADRCMNLCEMKFSEGEFVIDKPLARELQRKRDVFREVTGSSKALFTTLVTGSSLRTNEHSRQQVACAVTLDALFARP